MATRLKLLGGDGNVTATLSAATWANATVVTLPATEGYEYDVSIAVMLKMSATTPAVSAGCLIGGAAYPLYATSAGRAVGDIYPIPGVVNTNTLTTPYYSTSTAMFDNAAATVNTGDTFAKAIGREQTARIFKAGPGAVISVPIYSNLADTYYIHYNYIGRKFTPALN